MKKIIGVLIIAILSGFGCADNRGNVNDEQIIVSHLQAQQECWNNGDIDCFMSHYWNNDSLMFVSGSRVSYGWQSVTDNYKKKYYSKELMGKLQFEIVKVEYLSPESYLAIGSWDLKRPSGNIGGMFSLLWKKVEGEWVIVLDHTS